MQIHRCCGIAPVVMIGVLIPSLTLGQAPEQQQPQQRSEDAELREGLRLMVELTSRSLSDRASQWQCRPESGNVCGSGGCTETEPTVWVNLDFDGLRYGRCDPKGCSDNLMEVNRSGIYTTVTSTGGTFLKVVNDGSESVEVVSLGTAVWVYHGRCTPR